MKKDKTKLPFYMYTAAGKGRLVNSRMDQETMEIVEILHGTVNVQIGTEIIEARQGDFIYVPPTLIYRVDSEDQQAYVRAIAFNSSILEADMDNFDSEVFYMFYLQSKNKIAHFTNDHPVRATLARYMQEAYDEYVSKDVCYKLPIRANLYFLMTALLRYYCGSKNESDRMVYHNVLRLRPVIEYITEHYCEKIYVDMLADMINVSPDYFTKMFNASIGKTPIEYINGLRINEAMRMLTETDYSMSEIAESIGFCNPNYFHKIFKQYMNISPLAYRKSTR